MQENNRQNNGSDNNQGYPVIERTPKLRNYISYGVGDFLGGGSFILIGVLFLNFMTQVVGMNPFYAGLLILIGKLWDGISDPMMGYITDRTRSRFGRRRVFFLIGMLPVFLTFSSLWIPVNIESQFALFMWYLVLFLLFSTAYTVTVVPYVALITDISLDYKIRSKFSGFKQFSSGFAGALCVVASQPIVSLFPPEEVHIGYMVMGIIYALFFSLPWIAVFFGTWELPRQLEEVKRQTPKEILRNFYSVFRNKSFRLHVGMFAFSFAGMDFVMALFLYFLEFYLEQPGLFPILMACFAGSQAISIGIYIKIANTYGKSKAYLVGTVMWMAGLTIMLTVPQESYSLAVLIISTMFLGSGICGATTMPWVMLPSVADVDEMITTEKRSGIYAGMMTLIRKIVSGVTIFLVGVSLNFIGFDQEAAAQSVETQSYLRLLFIFGPFLVVFCGMLFSFKFKITPYTHRTLRNEIERLENGGSKDDCDKETRDVCQLLSGQEYETLYKNSDKGS